MFKDRTSIALAGAAVTLIGLFVPIASMPFLGTVNLFGNGTNIAPICLLVITLIAGAMLLQKKPRAARIPAIAATVIIVALFVNLLIVMSQMQSMIDELEDSLLSGMADMAARSVQIQWGWLVLGLGAGMMVFGTWSAREDDVDDAGEIDTRSTNLAAIASFILGTVALGVILFHHVDDGDDVAAVTEDGADNEDFSELFEMDADADMKGGTKAERLSYARQYVDVYDLEAKYYDSLLDGRIPGVDFKIKNNGNRTLDRVEVTVEFLDADGNAIAEENYTPVLAGSYMSDGGPLRPNYIWRQERGRFLSAKSVPEEWQSGSARARVTDIGFSAEESPPTE